VIRHGNYEKADGGAGLKSISIMKTHSGLSLKGSVWFKDRKGDIFAFHNGVLSLFKYHLKDQAFKEIELIHDTAFTQVECQQSVLYIAQTDRVYYFDNSQPSSSFYL
jgi:hypothetical protein